MAIVNHPVRKGGTIFSTEERLSFIDEATQHLANVRTTSFDVLVVEFARRVGRTGDRQGAARDLGLSSTRWR